MYFSSFSCIKKEAACSFYANVLFIPSILAFIGLSRTLKDPHQFPWKAAVNPSISFRFPGKTFLTADFDILCVSFYMQSSLAWCTRVRCEASFMSLKRVPGRWRGLRCVSTCLIMRMVCISKMMWLCTRARVSCAQRLIKSTQCPLGLRVRVCKCGCVHSPITVDWINVAPV